MIDLVTLAMIQNIGSKVEDLPEKFQKILDEAPEEYDTLKEIADWINTHEEQFRELQRLVDNLDTILDKKISEKIKELYDDLASAASALCDSIGG